MSLVRHTDPRAFLAAAEPMAARSETTRALVTASVERLIATPPTDDERLYLATYRSASACGFAMLRRQNYLIVEDSDAEAAIAFARDLATDFGDLDGIVGARAACDAFAAVWREATARVAIERLRLRHHVLSQVTPASAPGVMRIATEVDADWLVAAEKAFIADAGLPDDPERVTKSLRTRLEQRLLRIWDDDGPVAYAGFSPAGSEYARIGPVWTQPQWRRRGYAAALVALLSQQLLDVGRRRIFLVTDVKNPTSNAIYARIGFRPLHEFHHFDFVEP